MNMNEESEGTRNVFGIAPLFKRAFESTGETICIDEFDKSLHPELVQHLIDLFNDETRLFYHLEALWGDDKNTTKY